MVLLGVPVRPAPHQESQAATAARLLGVLMQCLSDVFLRYTLVPRLKKLQAESLQQGTPQAVLQTRARRYDGCRITRASGSG